MTTANTFDSDVKPKGIWLARAVLAVLFLVALFCGWTYVRHQLRVARATALLYQVDRDAYGMTPAQVDAKVAEIEKSAGVSHLEALNAALALSGHPSR